MKIKIILPLLAIFFLLACQSDDDQPNVETVDDPITGYWFPVKSIKVYEDDSSQENMYVDCKNGAPSHLYFHNTIEKHFFQIYKERINNETCFYNGGSGNWSKLNDTSYQVDLEYFPESNYKSGESTTIAYKVEFINNDLIHIQDQNEFLELQTAEPNLVDFYRVFEYHDELFE